MITGNSATGGGVGYSSTSNAAGAADDGGIYAAASFSITSTSVSGNNAIGGNGPSDDNDFENAGNGYGGAIATIADLTVSGSTLWHTNNRLTL